MDIVKLEAFDTLVIQMLQQQQVSSPPVFGELLGRLYASHLHVILGFEPSIRYLSS
jgi:hypothetical protein